MTWLHSSLITTPTVNDSALSSADTKVHTGRTKGCGIVGIYPAINKMATTLHLVIFITNKHILLIVC